MRRDQLRPWRCFARVVALRSTLLGRPVGGPVRSFLGGWPLLVVLALGVVAMHHVPLGHEHADAPAAAAAGHAGSHGAGPPGAGRFTSAGSAAEAAPLVAAQEGAGGGHGGLHLCLAVLVGAAAVLVSLVPARTVPSPSAPKRPGGRVEFPRIRLPPRLLRRLAVLCVLRL